MTDPQAGQPADDEPRPPFTRNQDNIEAEIWGNDPEEQSARDTADQAEGVAGQLERELAEANGRALRAQAELENYRKRARRELEEETRYAALPLMRDVLQVVDNLQLAIQAAEQHEDSAGLLEGVKMVSRQLTDVLKRHHCVEIEADGTPFDPHLHEAIMYEPSDRHPAGINTRVARGGYRLHDRVVRPAQVCVSRGSVEPREPESTSS